LEFGLRNNKNYKSNILEFLIAISLVISGITIVNLKDSSAYKNYVGNNPKLINQEHEFEVSIIKPISVKNKKITLKGNLKSYENEGYRSLIVGKILIHLKSDSNSLKLLPGDVINFSSKLIELSSSGNPHQFNYAKYLKSKQIKYHTFVNSNWRLIKSSYSLLRFSTIVKKNEIHIIGNKKIKSVNIRTAPYPGFPTDLQAQIMVLLCKANKKSIIKEEIFENRFMHVAELNRMGAQISTEGNKAIINGNIKFQSAELMATDLRASVSLILAALVSKGRSVINRIYHLDRGYEDIEKKMKKIGAKIRRID